MSSDELDAFLAEERTCRVATIGRDGAPHASPLWFAWDGTSLWLNSLFRSQRWTDVARDPRTSVIVDAGEDYGELRGVELIGRLEQVGEVPRTTTPDPQLAEIERLYADKYNDGTFRVDGRHAWLRLTPDKVVSWDFRKIER